MLAVITDRRFAIEDAGATGNVKYYEPDVIAAQDYHPFGMLLSGRSWEAGSGYRYGFNSQEQDDDVYGNGNLNTATFWEYDSRLGRRWNVDPIVKSNESPFAVFGLNPIIFTDVNGDNKDWYWYSEDGEDYYAWVPDHSFENGNYTWEFGGNDWIWLSSDYNDPFVRDGSESVSSERFDKMQNPTETLYGLITGQPYEIPTGGLDRGLALGKGYALEGIYWFNKNINFAYIVPNSVQGYYTEKDLITGNNLSSGEATTDLLGIVPVGKFGKVSGVALDLAQAGVKQEAAMTSTTVVEQAAVHGNSLKSLKPTWGYKLYSTDGTFLKNGITSKLVPESRYTKAFMMDKKMVPFKQFPNRLEAYQWESQQNQILRGPLNLNMH